jgi:TRAP-type C4-dicarboxylate transport system substrate-binding protein
VVSAQWFDGLPEEYQSALIEECRKAGQKTSQVVQKAVDDARAKLKETGMTINDDVDLDAFRKAGDKAYEVLDLVEAKDKVWAEIGKN